MHPEKYSLTWHHYSEHLRSIMKELMMTDDFSDVTLVTEDKKQIKANISILSFCSPVFKDILKKEKNSNSIMYLRGIQHSEMESIMQFIYLGEATVYQKKIEEFLSVAKSLEIKELCNAETNAYDEPEDQPSESYPETKAEKFKKHIKISDKMNEQAIQSRQDGDVSVKNECLKTYSDNKTLRRHCQSVNEFVKYVCNQCDYQANRQDNLTVHIQSKHEGVKHPCKQCDQQFSTQSHLIRHIRSMHEGIKYACDQCDYQGQQKGSLKLHIQVKHEGVKYTCDLCDYVTAWKTEMTKHKRKNHKIRK